VGGHPITVALKGLAYMVSQLTHEIATAQAWKTFLVLSVAAGTMFILIATNRFGFVLFVAALFGWLTSMAVELVRANGVPTKRMGTVGALGFAFALGFSFPDYLAFAIPKAFAPYSVVISGFGFLGCMLYLMLCIGPLLAKLEERMGTKPRANAALLVWLWPIGIWFLQPRLRQVLRNLPAT
jgi:hypothetical protein